MTLFRDGTNWTLDWTGLVDAKMDWKTDAIFRAGPAYAVLLRFKFASRPHSVARVHMYYVPVLSQYSINVERHGCKLFRHFEKLMMAGLVSNTVTDTIVISSGSDSSEVTPVKNFPASQSEEFNTQHDLLQLIIILG